MEFDAVHGWPTWQDNGKAVDILLPDGERIIDYLCTVAMGCDGENEWPVFILQVTKIPFVHALAWRLNEPDAVWKQGGMYDDNRFKCVTCGQSVEKTHD